MKADSHFCRIAIVVVAGLLVWPAGLCPTVAADSGVVEIRPQQRSRGSLPPRTSKKTGLLIRLDTRWCEGYGYRPVRFVIESPKPATVDRTIALSLSVHDWRHYDHAVEVSQSVVLPAGATSVTTTLAVPQLHSWRSISWRVSVDGVFDEEISSGKREVIAHPPRQGATFVILSKAPRQAATVRTAFDPRNQRTVTGDGSEPDFDGYTLEEVRQPLPDRWLLYTTLDVVRLTVDQLTATAAEQPTTFAALRRWVEAGGTLWIENAGEGFRGGEEVSPLLEFDTRPQFLTDAEAAGPLADLPQWRWVNLYWRDRNEGMDFGDDPIAPGSRRRQRSGVTTSQNLFAEASLGLGVVALFEGTWEQARRAAPGRRAEAAFVRHWTRRSWPQRHGLLPDAANTDFSNLLIPEVGLAPVMEFRVLITLFVLVVGPVNFWLLSRRQRGHLMVLTVPAMAALLTLCLFAYAILSDGFGVQLRTRGVTLLDQRAGEQTTWSRNCYYAGLAPSGGMVFPASAAVYPILPGWEEIATDATLRSRTAEWSPAPGRGVEQRLRRGWLTSRESTQMLVVDAASTPAKIEFTQRGDRLLATNTLGGDIELLVVIDGAGNHWLCESAGEGETTPLGSLSKAEAVAKLRDLVTANQPTLPAGMEAASRNPMLSQQRRQLRRRLRRELGMDYAEISLGDNLMNETLERLIGLDGSPPLALPPRSYVAICPQTVITSVGLNGAKHCESLHVVIGRW